MDDGDIAEIEELRGQCRLLRGDDDSGGKVALLAVDGEEAFDELDRFARFGEKLQDVSA
jgi:hypothetical protein